MTKSCRGVRAVTFCMLLLLFGSCAKDYETAGVVYSGNAPLNSQIRQFSAVDDGNESDIVITKTGTRELTLNYNKSLSHIDYEDDVVIITSETDNKKWTARKVRGGFELEDGIRLQYGNCKGWTICLLDSAKLPLLMGSYRQAGRNLEIRLWISESEKHVELLALMVNGLLNRSRNARESIDSSFGTLSSQVWAY